MRNYVIRSLRKDETDLLKDFLYEAIFIPKGTEPPERDIIEKPELRVYTDDFGSKKGDHCLVADIGGKVAGAVWTRIMDDYGHVDDETPSFAISLYNLSFAFWYGVNHARSLQASQETCCPAPALRLTIGQSGSARRPPSFLWRQTMRGARVMTDH